MENNLTSDEPLKSLGVEFFIGEAERILPGEHAILFEGRKFPCRELILRGSSMSGRTGII